MVRRVVAMLVCVLWLGPAWGAEFRASVDRTQLQVHEPLLLTLSLINSDTRLRAQGVDPNIDLTRLGDAFDVGRPEASTHYNIYRGQGRSTSEIQVEIFPTRSGTLTIPAFHIDGLSSAPIEIEVLKQDAALPDEVFVRSGADVASESTWVGQQLVAWVDLYHRVALESASLGSNVETAPVQIELLPNWKLPQETRQERIDGLDYEVQRSAWAVFPNQAGPFTVELPDIWVTTQAGAQLRLPHQRLEFQVQALPPDVPADIIVGTPQLTAEPLPEAFTQYELSEWTLTLKAPVGVTTLPRLLPGIELPAGLKLFPDPARYHTQQDSSGIMDAADYSLGIMPLAAGEFELPAIRVPYFDPERGQAALVELPGRTISVAAGTLPQPASDITDTAVNAAGAAAAEVPSGIGIWHISTLVLALLWLSTLYLWRRQPNRTKVSTLSEAPAAGPAKDERQPLQQQLLAAMNSRTLEQGVQQWLQHQPDDRVVLDAVRAVQRFYYGHGEQSEADVQAKVQQALSLIKKTPVPSQSNTSDPWRAESFSQRP